MAPAPARVSAAKTVLELALKAVEIEDLSARIETLEAAAKAATVRERLAKHRSEARCASCHTRVMPDGSILTVYYYNLFNKYFLGGTSWKP
jgi:hypothetical protein